MWPDTLPKAMNEPQDIRKPHLSIFIMEFQQFDVLPLFISRCASCYSASITSLFSLLPLILHCLCCLAQLIMYIVPQ